MTSPLKKLLLAGCFKIFSGRPEDQARGQDLAAGGAKNQKGGHIFKIQYLMYAATRGPNVKWGASISNGGGGTTGPPAGDCPAEDWTASGPCHH